MLDEQPAQAEPPIRLEQVHSMWTPQTHFLWGVSARHRGGESRANGDESEIQARRMGDRHLQAQCDDGCYQKAVAVYHRDSLRMAYSAHHDFLGCGEMRHDAQNREVHQPLLRNRTRIGGLLDAHHRQ